ncbi:hypothetical protein V6N12_030885 [Hibiscus sabdariffa]|uniref:Uncharacterized protein n=1 Tax=Hibiscus sabdariffa TaxID=183260 RepID=A0ABR2E9B1_9ROSI
MAVGSASSNEGWRWDHVALSRPLLRLVGDNWASGIHAGSHGAASGARCCQPGRRVGAWKRSKGHLIPLWTVGSRCDPTVEIQLRKEKDKGKLGFALGFPFDWASEPGLYM